MHQDRLPLYEHLEKDRRTTVITYVTGDRPGMETQIHPEVLEYFVHHLDLIGVTKKISLFLYTRGGSTLASWSIVHLLRQFCDELEVIVPSKAHSGGTMICLGANRIVMTKQAMLGPIDPSVNGPLNPVPAPGQPTVPVSVEAINGFIEFAKGAVDKTSKEGMTTALQQLSTAVHPLVLGNVYRTRAQIRMLAERLIEISGQYKEKDAKDRKRALDFLCSESGSHDYTIFRREAENTLKLAVEKPGVQGYKLIKALYDDIAKELELTTPFDFNTVIAKEKNQPDPNEKKASYSCRRILIESRAGGVHVHVSEGTVTKRMTPPPSLPPQLAQMLPLIPIIQDDRMFEGWRHEA